jgi:RNA polymerase sigma-70 factor, ECF subfamily
VLDGNPRRRLTVDRTTAPIVVQAKDSCDSALRSCVVKMGANGRKDYEALIEPIERQMIGVVWGIIRDPADFEDAFQEATIKDWKALPKAMKHPNPHAFIMRICINAAYDELRRQNRRKQKELPVHTDDFPQTREYDPTESERRERILAAISGLPRQQAESVLMRFMEGMPYPAIAQAMNCAESTVRTHIERGCKKLHEILSDLDTA